jgi:hypothetical protein
MARNTKEYQRKYFENQEHRDAKNARSKLWRQKESSKLYMRRKSKVYSIKIKVEVLSHYGNGQCACIKCGFSDVRALSIDHINGDGSTQKINGVRIHSGITFYRWLKREGYPEGYQTLCMNCQFIKRDVNREYKYKGTANATV